MPSDMYSQAFQESEKQVAPNSPMNLFREETLNKYHVDSAKDIGDKFAAYIDGICGAVCDGIDLWLLQATISGVVINGPVGLLTPGCVSGPPLDAQILSFAPMGTPQEIKYSKAIASAFGTLWQTWHSGLSGILMYPAFVAFPGPTAPPTPNVPLPLIAMASPGEAGLSPASLKGAMEGNLGDPTAVHAADLFDAIAKAFSTVFTIFKATTMVKNVLGFGPIPTFAPPFVPVGPVVGGSVIGAPGCLS